MRLRGVATGLQVSGASIAAFVGLWLAPMTGGLVRAETPELSPGGPISLGNRGWSAAATEGAAPVVNRRPNLTPDRRPILTPCGHEFWR